MIRDAGTAAFAPPIEQLRRLSEVNRAFTYTTTLEEVAQLTVQRGADLLGARAAVLMLRDSDASLHVRAVYGVGDERMEQFRAPLAGEVMDRLEGLLAAPGEQCVAVPLVSGGAVTGLVAVALEQHATEGDEWLLSAFADQAATALESARTGGEMRAELEARLHVMQGATNAKDRALATLAHDIRSPLGAIDGYCAILEEEMYGPITERQRQALARMRMSGRHLLSLLDTVMDMARLSVGALDVRSGTVQLADVVQQAHDMFLPASGAKRQRLGAVIEHDVQVTGDAARLRQVLVNLVGNAVKFTPVDGAITITVVERRDSAGNGHGEICVSDTGPGIPEADRSAIFEAYYRSEGTADLPGVGLGLAISHALVTQMGGELLVESEVGVGSSFIIRLPLLPIAPAQ